MFNSYELFDDSTWTMWPFNTGDCVIDVAAWPGLTKYNRLIYKMYSNLSLQIFYLIKCYMRMRVNVPTETKYSYCVYSIIIHV